MPSLALSCSVNSKISCNHSYRLAQLQLIAWTRIVHLLLPCAQELCLSLQAYTVCISMKQLLSFHSFSHEMVVATRCYVCLELDFFTLLGVYCCAILNKKQSMHMRADLISVSACTYIAQPFHCTGSSSAVSLTVCCISTVSRATEENSEYCQPMMGIPVFSFFPIHKSSVFA